MIKATLRTREDCCKFVSGHYANDPEPNMKMYQFDRCVSDDQHPRRVRDQTKAMLRKWLMHAGSPEATKFCFLFGSSLTGKSDELNLMNNNSII